MGTTRIKVIDLSSDEKETKTPRKRAQKAPEAKIQDKKSEQVTHEQTPQEATSPLASENRHEEPQKITPKAEKKEVTTARKSNRHQGKRYKQALALIGEKTAYSPKEATVLLRKVSITNFDPAVELHLNVTDKDIKGKVNLPHAVESTKRQKCYLVFSDKKTADVKNVIWADENTISEIESGKLKPGRNFDAVITTPKFMPLLAKVAKILGPRGMMPNPKNGTITDDPVKIITNQEDSAYEYRTDPTAPILHTKIGKLSYKDQDLIENMKALIASVGVSKIKKATLKSTMSPAIKIDIATVGK